MSNLFIFDMGNVITKSVDVIPPMAAKLNLPEEEIRTVCGDSFFGLTTGKITTRDFWREFAAVFDIYTGEDYLATLFNPVVDEKMAELVVKLRAEGNTAVCGTNTIESHYRIHSDRGDYDIFDRVYASQLIGLAKPDPEFYRYIIREEENLTGNKPENIIFIDDLPENVESARKTGITSFVFTNPEELGVFLRGNGFTSDSRPV